MLAGLRYGPGINLQRMLEIVQGLGNKSVGAVRVSVGLATNFDDVHRFMAFAAGFKDRDSLQLGDVTFNITGCRVLRDGA